MRPDDGTSVRPERLREGEAVLDAVRSWASGRPDLHAVALVGSCGAGSADSDVDLVLLSSTPAAYIDAAGLLKSLRDALSPAQ